MNILLSQNQFSLLNTFFSDKKENIIVEGTFTKLLYSTQFFVMNGLYFQFPIPYFNIATSGQNTYINFDINKQMNHTCIQQFVKMENSILEYYRQMNKTNKRLSHILTRQLCSGNMKLYRDLQRKLKVPCKLVIKISGIWESDNEIGLAIKLLCY